MVDDSQLAASKSIHKTTGKTFWYATRVLPKRVREATYVLYAFFRVADEVVDDAGDASPAEQRAELERIREAALGDDSDDPVLTAFSEMRETYDIPDEEVHTFIDAMSADIETDRYQTFEDVRDYMRGSAAAVGVMMTYVMEPDDVSLAVPHARKLGEAFQMTNFLRDVGEDIDELDRVYLPIDTLERYGSSVEELRDKEATPAFREAMEAELHRTETLYDEGIKGIAYLPRDCQFAILVSAILYAEHHRLIRERNYDTLSATPSISKRRKLSVLVRARWHWTWNKDPEAVFATVSSVPNAETRSHGERVSPSPTQ
ncbi:geranylgeranyl-diphosphate geranylgeranyltransferase [Halobacteriales archaeon QH_7_65_31]|nr:MAG: geranylgeranyl-diphosphate geranylgeranyltransferase [Halobacteriales archaeon QH_7_65_31]